MKGDFSRNTFRPFRHYSRVLMQQGRVLLDSDWNEQGSIFLHYLQSLAKDLIGPYGGPAGNCGFKVISSMDDSEFPKDFPIEARTHNFGIGGGHYYVDGLLCENGDFTTYARKEAAPGRSQADFLADELAVGDHLVYLDVWERHLTALEDAEIREVALGAQGPDTTTRAKVVWQVKTIELKGPLADLTCDNSVPPPPNDAHAAWLAQVKEWQPELRGLLKAKADEPDDITATNPCIISPDARYRGAENQLYRVEIHDGGLANAPAPATFKWSREDGSVALPIRNVAGNKVTLEHLGRDARFSVQVGDWVEIEGLNYEQRELQEVPPLLQVEEVSYIDMIVTLREMVATSNPRVLRRWDHKAGDVRVGGLELRHGAALIKESRAPTENWLNLEDGIKIQFVQAAAPSTSTYRRGDYWLIPARTATGDVEWPGPLNAPEALPPHGVEHHYAPLARITVAANSVTVVADLRRKFNSLAIVCEPA